LYKNTDDATDNEYNIFTFNIDKHYSCKNIKIKYPGKTRCRHAKDNNWFTRLSHVDLNTYNYLSRVVVVRPLWCFVV